MKQIKITKEDITIWNSAHYLSDRYTFSIEIITEKILKDEDCGILEDAFSKEEIFADMFNTEYMGFLTGEVKCSKDVVVRVLNKFFKNYKLKKSK